MPRVEIYTALLCGFCARARALLDRKGVAYEEIDVTADAARRREMRQRAGGAGTVPQLFIDGRHVGDCDEVLRLDAAGRLDAMLGRGA